MNPYVFLVGCPRSGTTLLRRIADAHPQLAVARGTRWIPRTFEFRRCLTEDGHVTPVRETFTSEVRARGRPLPHAWSPETVAAVP